MEPPCEHGGVLRAHRRNESRPRASMEPPCEHGGVFCAYRVHGRVTHASMEPPCEHGGVTPGESYADEALLLQWSRRVNTAE